jgi:hypothetical protein
MNDVDKNYYYKIQRPFSIYKARAMENYFNYMSKQGKHIVSLSEGFFDEFAFEEGVYLDKKYKLLLSKQKKPSEKLESELKDLGWEYVCSTQPKFRKQRFHLFREETEDANTDIVEKKNKEAISKFQQANILSVLTSKMTLAGIFAFVFIILIFGINNGTGRNLAGAILVLFVISDLVRYYFERVYEKEYIEEVTRKDASIREWEIEKQRYDKKEIILRIGFSIAILALVFIRTA